MYTSITVKQILERKGYDIWSLETDISVLDALRFMAEKNIGAVMVTENGELVGVFSERDYARKVSLKGKSDRETLIGDVMTRTVIGIDIHQKIEDCLVLMTGKFIRHLPVIDDDQQVVGVISIGDVVKELVAEQTFVIEQLVHYITRAKPKPPIPQKLPVELS